MCKNIVVILIIVHKKNPNRYEAISLRRCLRVLGAHPIRIVCPRGLDTSRYSEIAPGIEFDFIDPKWQVSYARFNRLKIEPFLYNRYRNYQFILFYELDAFVFRDELLDWCKAGFDYIGAPWFDLPWMRDIEGLAEYNDGADHYERAAVGNGGLSLRRVDAARRVLHSFSWVYPPRKIWETKGRSFAWKLSRLIKASTITNNSFHVINTFEGNEDLFWGIYMKRNFDWFTVAPIAEALKFSQHGAPSYKLRQSGTLPFGCHGWWKENAEFWTPLVEQVAKMPDAVRSSGEVI